MSSPLGAKSLQPAQEFDIAAYVGVVLGLQPPFQFVDPLLVFERSSK